MRKPTAPPEDILPMINPPENTQPVYPDLSTVIPVKDADVNQDAQNFRLKQIRDIRDQLEKEAETRGRLRRRYKALYNTAYYINLDLV